LSGEVLIVSNVGHGREYRRQASTLGPTQCSFQNFPVFLLGAAVVLSRTLLQSCDQVIGQITNNELRHVHFLRSFAINDSNT
jgi:hypothetical protein